MRTSLWALVEERAEASADGEMMVDERGRRMTFGSTAPRRFAPPRDLRGRASRTAPR